MGRGKGFDEKAVLQRVMVLFWRKGYEKTSMQDLVDHMNIHRRSIYDTFGDKQTLFQRCLETFEEMTLIKMQQHVKSVHSVKEAIKTLFEMTVFVYDGRPRGCLIVNTAIELALHDEHIAERINKSFEKMESFIYELLLQGKMNGELSDRLDLEKMAQYIHNAFIGIRVLAKMTDDREKLKGIIETTLAALD